MRTGDGYYRTVTIICDRGRKGTLFCICRQGRYVDTKIERIPKIPPGLRDAAQRGVLIPFVGAGASRLAGSPGWKEFADRLLQQLVGAGRLTYAEVELLRHLTPRVKLSLAQSLAKQFEHLIDYSKLLHTDDQTKKEMGDRLHRALLSLGTTFVTTNYDEWLDKMKAPEPPIVDTVSAQPQIPNGPTQMNAVCRKYDFVVNMFQPNTVIHLHGCMKDLDSMVLTMADYMHHYANDRDGDENQVLTFLKNLFGMRSVLFVGYGLEEYEILEQIIMQARRASETGRVEDRHYLLQGFFSHESKLVEHLSNYYRHDCGVVLLPFLRDEKDREQIVDVLEAFAEQIPASSPMVLQDLNDMENLL